MNPNDPSVPKTDVESEAEPGIETGNELKTEIEKKKSSAQSFERLPVWAKLIFLCCVIGVIYIGYMNARFLHNPASQTSALAASEADPEELAKRPQIENFTLTDADGRQKTLSDYRGHVLILSFWASWCTPCLVELPTFGVLEKQFGGRGLRVLAINVDEGDIGKKFAKDLWAAKQLSLPSFFDSTKTLAQGFDVNMLPSNFVLDRQGRLVFSGFGANNWNSPQTLEFLEALLFEEPAE